MRRLRRILLWLAGALALLLVLSAVPIVFVEARCTGAPAARAPERTLDIRAANYRRAVGDSYLTFPEWYIVYAYDDLAGVTRAASESSFGYVASIRGFWTSLCGVTEAASAVGPVTRDQRITNYIIGVSFTAELAIKGLWERTVGALAVLARGASRTPEDEFALRLLDDYAASLRQTPWYQYPFGPELARFWRETPLTGGNPVRKIERRIALTLEYGVKAVYAKAIGWLAGYSPADLRIMSVVRGLDESDLAADRRITRRADLGDGLVLIETPRYQEFTEIVRGLAARDRSVEEIAGNRRILATVLAPAGTSRETAGAREIFSLDIQSRPGWRRSGFDVEVPQLTRLISAVESRGAVFEHAYDY